MIYPTKKLKYSGTIRVWPGDSIVYMPDGTIKTYREIFAGFASSNNEEENQTEIEFYTQNIEEVEKRLEDK